MILSRDVSVFTHRCVHKRTRQQVCTYRRRGRCQPLRVLPRVASHRSRAQVSQTKPPAELAQTSAKRRVQIRVAVCTSWIDVACWAAVPHGRSSVLGVRIPTTVCNQRRRLRLRLRLRLESMGSRGHS